MANFQMVGPKSIEEILIFLGQKEGSVAFLSGGTDFIIDFREHGFKHDLVIDLSQVEELNYIKEEDGWVKIGAVTSFAQIASNILIKKKARCLAQAACQIGSVQIRNRGTIGGNVASAAPAGDSIPALLALEGVVTVTGLRGRKTIPLDRMITGAGSTCLEDGEFIEEIAFPILDDSFISGFEKIGSRTQVSIARLSLAAVIKYNRKNNIIEQGKIVAGAIGPKAFHLLEIEEYITGRKIDSDLFSQIGVQFQAAVDRAIPGRYSQNYKRQAIQGAAEDLVQNLFGSIATFPSMLRKEKR